MSRARAPVTQSELTRYAKAMRAAGYEDWRIEVAKPDGTKVSIHAGKAAEDDSEVDDFDSMIGRLP